MELKLKYFFAFVLFFIRSDPGIIAIELVLPIIVTAWAHAARRLVIVEGEDRLHCYVLYLQSNIRVAGGSNFRDFVVLNSY